MPQSTASGANAQSSGNPDGHWYYKNESGKKSKNVYGSIGMPTAQHDSLIRGTYPPRNKYEENKTGEECRNVWGSLYDKDNFKEFLK